MQLQWKNIIRVIHLEEVALSVFYEKGLSKLQCQTTDLLLQNTIWFQIYESLQKPSDRTNVIQKDVKVTLNKKKLNSFTSTVSLACPFQVFQHKISNIINIGCFPILQTLKEDYLGKKKKNPTGKMFPACWHTNSSMLMLIKGFHMLSKESYKQTDTK